MATQIPDGNSPPKCTVIRQRSRFPKAKPNILDAGRRIGKTLPPVTKSVVSPGIPDDGLRSPPPVRRMARLDVLPPVLPTTSSDTLPQPSPSSPSSPAATSSCTLPLSSASNTQLCSTVSSCTSLQSPSQLSETRGIDTERLSPELASPESQTAAPSLPQDAPSVREKSQSSSLSSPNKKKLERKSVSRRINTCDKDETRRRHVRIKGQNVPERGKMTMFDLIYWNPEDNPMKYEEDECRIPLSNKEANGQTSTNAERLAEEAVDDPDFAEEENCPDVRNKNQPETETEKEEMMPVPQVKIGPDGNIILDEQSLVIETSASKKDLSSSPVVYERSSNVTYASFRNKKPSRNWSDKETTKFYMALSTVGTDFSMMGKLFPKRARNELKLKFKREERFNKALVDKAIHDRQQYDLSLFEESDEETENVDAIRPTVKRAKSYKTKGRNRTQIKDKETENIAKKQTTRRSHKSRRGLQEQSDSDFEVEELTSTTNTTHNNDNSMASENAEPSVNSGDAVVPDPHCETSSENFPTTDKDSYVNENNESEVDDDVDGCNKILEGVLKQTRYGRNPKKRSPFTIDVAEPKKRQRRESKKSSEDVDEVSSPPQSLSLPLNTNSSPGRIVNATINGSPGHLLVLSENQNNGCQIVQLYMVSPPPQTKPNTGFTTPVAEHDYVQPVEQTETVIATLPDDGTCIEITNATFESLDGVELLIPQEVVYEERLINTGESLQPYATQ